MSSARKNTRGKRVSLRGHPGTGYRIMDGQWQTVVHSTCMIRRRLRIKRFRLEHASCSRTWQMGGRLLPLSETVALSLKVALLTFQWQALKSSALSKGSHWPPSRFSGKFSAIVGSASGTTSRFEFNKAKSGLFFSELKEIIIFDSMILIVYQVTFILSIYCKYGNR